MSSKDNSGESCRFPLDFLRHILGGSGEAPWSHPVEMEAQALLSVFSSTILAGDDGHRVTYEWGKKYRLSSELLILRREVRLLFFPTCTYFSEFFFSFHAALSLILWLRRTSLPKAFLVSVFFAFCLFQTTNFSSTPVTKLNWGSLPMFNKANLLTLGWGEKSTAFIVKLVLTENKTKQNKKPKSWELYLFSGIC